MALPDLTHLEIQIDTFNFVFLFPSSMTKFSVPIKTILRIHFLSRNKLSRRARPARPSASACAPRACILFRFYCLGVPKECSWHSVHPGGYLRICKLHSHRVTVIRSVGSPDGLSCPRRLRLRSSPTGCVRAEPVDASSAGLPSGQPCGIPAARLAG